MITLSKPRRLDGLLALRLAILLPLLCGLGHAQTPLWTLSGTPNERLASDADGGFDVDGDGLPDVVAGSSNSSIAGPTFGTVRVLKGSTGAVIHIVNGASTGSGFGASVALLGDLNGDGRAEFAVGSPTDAVGGANAGALYVYSGLDASLLYARQGAAGERLGAQLAAAGDVDLDGVPDLLIGMGSAGGGAGRVELLSGATWALILPAFVGAPAAAIGNVIAAGGDVDGDGVPDFMFSVATGTLTGSMAIHSGRTGALVRMSSPAFGPISAAFIGDLNQDGRDEYAYAVSQLFTYFLRAFDGATGAEIFVRSAVPAEPQIFVAGLGDVNGDCIPDLGALILSSLNFLGATVTATAFSGADFSQIAAYALPASTNPNVAFARAGDVDGDGYAEFVAASGQVLPTVPNGAGHLRVQNFGFSGTPPRLRSVGVACPGSAGNLALAAALGCPKLGQPLTLLCRNALPGASTVLNLGAPTSVALTPFGLPGCWLHATTDGFNLFLPADGSGTASSGPLTVPIDPSALGATLAVQFVCVDPSANAVGLVTSRGLALVIGS